MLTNALVKTIGRFVITKRLAEGGVAKVYLGQDEAGARVVIKVGSAADEDDFAKEATILKELHDPRIVRVIDWGSERGKVYIAMEYVSGVDLHNLLKVEKPLPLPIAALIAQDVAGALAVAHGAHMGIVHRDVTPTNILLGKDGAVKLADFGTAKWEAATVRTRTGIIKGKYEYLAPEQAAGSGVDHRTDIFCLGLVLYEMLAGKRAYDAADPYDLIELAVNATITPPAEVIPKGPIVKVIEKMLAAAPKDRFQTAAQAVKALAAAVPGVEKARADLATRVAAARGARSSRPKTRED